MDDAHVAWGDIYNFHSFASAAFTAPTSGKAAISCVIDPILGVPFTGRITFSVEDVATGMSYQLTSHAITGVGRSVYSAMATDLVPGHDYIATVDILCSASHRADLTVGTGEPAPFLPPPDTDPWPGLKLGLGLGAGGVMLLIALGIGVFLWLKR